MGVNQEHLDLLRADLAGEGISEKRMMGGICFLAEGHMVCGLHGRGAMFRVGPLAEDEARSLPGTGPMLFTGRPMRGFVDVSDAAITDPGLRGKLLAMALAFARAQPAKAPRSDRTPSKLVASARKTR